MSGVWLQCSVLADDTLNLDVMCDVWSTQQSIPDQFSLCTIDFIREKFNGSESTRRGGRARPHERPLPLHWPLWIAQPTSPDDTPAQEPFPLPLYTSYSALTV